MRFDEHMIRNLPAGEFSQADKEWLLNKFFPRSPVEEWKLNLRKGWNDARRWDALLTPTTEPSALGRYRHKHNDLLRLARQLPRTKPVGNRVTDFTSWIYSLYTPPPTHNQLQVGKNIEREIAKSMIDAPASENWELIFEDPLDGSASVYEISSLKIHEQPLIGIPDLVFREKRSGKILILERKVSNADIPSDGWPNLKAQLWCYGQIDAFINAPSVLLVGEVWGFGRKGINVRHTYNWTLDDPEFRQTNAQLFDLYGSD